MAIRKPRADRVIGILEGHYKERMGRLKTVVAYGSLERDIDLLVVLDLKDEQETKQLFFRTNTYVIDAAEISKKTLERRISLLDIAYTEPILTGKVILGDEKWFQNIRANLRSVKPTPEILGYLFKEGVRSLISARTYLYLHQQERDLRLLENEANLKTICGLVSGDSDPHVHSEFVQWFLINIFFACGYLSFCRYYSVNPNVTTLKELLNEKEAVLLAEIQRYRKKILKDRKRPSFGMMEELLTRLRAEFLSYSKQLGKLHNV